MRRLAIAWLLVAFSLGPFFVLLVKGEQGSAKSWLTDCLRRFIDSTRASRTSPPKEPRDIIFSCKNSHVVGLENVSSLPVWLQDLLCIVSTGGAHRERAFHTNDGSEVLFQVKNPVTINGIDLSVRDDLLSRVLLLSLPSIEEYERL